MQYQLPSSSVVQQGTLRLDTKVAAPPSLNPELVTNTNPASCGFANFFRVCLHAHRAGFGVLGGGGARALVVQGGGGGVAG